MAGRVKVMKKTVQPNVLQVKSQLPELRTRISIGHKTDTHNLLMDYLKTLPYKYGTQEDDEDSRPSHIGKPFNIKCAVGKGPPGLLGLIDFFVVDRRIDLSEISQVKVSVYPPPLKSSNYENTIEPALMLTRDRCFYVANSDQLLNYKMVDASKLQSMLGMAIPTNATQSIPEHVERGFGYHMSQTSAASLSLKYVDSNGFKTTIRDGKGSREKTIETRPLSRYIVVIDFIMTNSVFRETMKKTTGIVGDIAESKPDTAQGKMAKATLERMAESETDPLIIDVPPEEVTGSKEVETLYGEDDVEDVEMPQTDEALLAAIAGNI